MPNFNKAALIIFTLFAVSCEKDPSVGDTLIYGRVVESKTGLPMKGVSILRISWVRNSAYMYDDTTIVAITDQDGKFEARQHLTISHNGETFTSFSIYYENYVGTFPAIKISAINECNIKLVKAAFLKFRIKNSTPHDSTDLFTLSIQQGTIFGDGNYFAHGTNVDTTIVRPILPFYPIRFFWSTSKNHIENYNSERVTLQSGDTIYRSVFY
jgi:hypothetical protein